MPKGGGKNSDSQTDSGREGVTEYAAARARLEKFEPKLWAAAIEQKRLMGDFAAGTSDPGVASLHKLEQGAIGIFLAEQDKPLGVKPCENPDPRGSFGFVGVCAELVASSSFLPGTLILRFDGTKLDGVARETLRPFYWDKMSGSYRLVQNAGVGKEADYVWGRVTRPGIYALIGLHAHPLVIRLIMVGSVLRDILKGLKPERRKEVQEGLSRLLLDSAEMQEEIESPAALEAMTQGAWSRAFPDPMISRSAKTGFSDIKHLLDIYPTVTAGLPEMQLLQQGDRPGVFSGGDSGWLNLGPADLSGCVQEVALDARDTNRIYAASANGGVWRLDDTRRYPSLPWTPLTDHHTSLRTTAVAVAPSDSQLLYFGDGLGNLVRSSDQGATWTTVDNTNMGYIYKILIHPRTPNIIYVATSRGLWCTRNAGRDWDSNAGNTTLYDGDVTDAAMDPGNSSVLFIGVRGVGVVRSTDRGRIWFRSLLWEPHHDYWTDVNSQSTMIKLSLGRLGSQDTRTVAVKMGQEVFVNRRGGRSPGIGGESWISKGMVGESGYGNHCHVIAIDPFDNNVILAGAQQLLRTENGGTSWEVVVDYYQTIHADQQSVAFDPTHRGLVYLGNDGGVYRSENGGRNWSDLNFGLATAQFYALGISGSRAMSGMYHQGMVATGDVLSGSWELIEGGGWEFANVYGDPKHPGLYHVISGALCRRRYPNTGRDDFLIPWGSPGFQATSVAVDPRMGSPLVIAGARSHGRIMRTVEGESDRPLWTEEPGLLHIIGPDEFVASVAFAPSTPSLAYALTDRGRVFAKTDVASSASWEQRGRRPRTGGGYRQLVINPMHSDRLYHITGSRVARSENGGISWVEIQGSGANMLPSTEFNSIASYPHDARTLFLGADSGVFITQDEGQNWYPFDVGLPNAEVIEVFWHEGYLYAVTHGRGLWRCRPCL